MEEVNYRRVEKAIGYLLQNSRSQPSLEEVAAQVHMSPFHFQRVFSDWAGISPKKFLQFITLGELKKELAETRNLIDAAERVGLSAQSRVYDLFVRLEAVTPEEYRTGGKGIGIRYGFHDTPFGPCCIAYTARGVCSLRFTSAARRDAVAEIRRRWENADLTPDQEGTEKIVRRIFEWHPHGRPLNVLVKGTGFQVKVWEALLKIPFGSVASYRTVARSIRHPDAVRAVGAAVGANPVAYVIPCHRVIRSGGIIGDYHWGSERKAAIIGWERAKVIKT